MIRGHAGFAAGRGRIDDSDASPASLAIGPGRTDFLGQPRLLPGEMLTVATDRLSSVLVQTDRGGFWLASGDGPASFTAPEEVVTAAVHVQPPGVDRTGFSDRLHPRVDRAPIDWETLRWGGADYRAECPEQPGSLTVAANRRAVLRCEIRPGWARWRDATLGNPNQRAELRGLQPLPFDADVWISCPMMVEAGPDLEAGGWAILGQIWAQEDAADLVARTPVFRQVLYPDGSLVFATTSDPNATTTQQPTLVNRWSIPTFPRGQWHHFLHRIRLSRTSTGHLQSWWNGTQVYDADIPFGYNDVSGHYWKYGIYKHPSAMDSLVVHYRNVEAGTVNLLGRMSDPLPVS